ncbi:hypothetical protein ACFP56_16765 [Paenibacillus septentrionalis]|uniref:Bacteriophage SP-beta YorD domain-containing protein n=1 Tax=Paenibacillus septentrionalis TaxID=429342 RepID=A0ABW1V678_9BACL
MNLSFELITNDGQAEGYIILNNGTPWIVQDVYIPYPAETMAESAQLHIDAIIADHNAEPQPTEIELLRQELTDAKQQLADTQDALIELASILAGGAE